LENILNWINNKMEIIINIDNSDKDSIKELKDTLTNLKWKFTELKDEGYEDFNFKDLEKRGVF